ncbi:LINE-1 retrotransposable element ORF1 protein [Plecturocebus cupreus]
MLAKTAALKFVVRFFPGGLRSGFSVPFSISWMDCSDFPERQTSSKRRLSPVYSAPRAAEPRRRQKSRARRKGHAGDLWGSSTGNVLVRGQQKCIGKQGLEWTSSSPTEGGPLEGKLKKTRNNLIINKKDIHSGTLSESHQLQRPQVDKLTKMGRNQHKKDENTQNQNASPPPRDHNSSPAREQDWMENESDELTEISFRKWVITNFSELKEHVLTQCKETNNLEKRFDEMLTRINSLEKNINELMELKNTTRELHEAYTSFNS